MKWLQAKGVVYIMVNSKVNNIVDRLKEDNIEEFYFKNAVPDGYRLKLIKDSTIVDNIYLTKPEAEELLAKLHIKTDSILFKTFKLDFEKEAFFNRMLSAIHDLGMLKRESIASDVTKEELIASVNLLKALTKDNELASIDVEGMQQEELNNIVHRKHLEYYVKFKDIVLAEVLS